MTATSILDNVHLSNPEYSNFIALSRYARWDDKLKRRETWDETVDRFFAFWESNNKLTKDDVSQLRPSVVGMKTMPSMRALMTAGIAASRDNVGVFNCAYTAVKRITDFDEILYILSVGTGVGFSCERQFITNLPAICQPLDRSIYERNKINYPGVDKDELSYIENNCVYVADSKYGWASSLRIILVELYNGNFDVTWDVSKVRPKGAPLKTFGGRASGPEPLVDLFKYCKALFKRKVNYSKDSKQMLTGEKLTSIDVHGLVCKIAEVIVVGGVEANI